MLVIESFSIVISSLSFTRSWNTNDTEVNKLLRTRFTAGHDHYQLPTINRINVDGLCKILISPRKTGYICFGDWIDEMNDLQVNWQTTMSLAFQSIGVVYGDIGTSPLYVYASTFTERIKDTEDILGVLSLIIYTIALVPLLKYVFIVLLANDNGDGTHVYLYCASYTYHDYRDNVHDHFM